VRLTTVVALLGLALAACAPPPAIEVDPSVRMVVVVRHAEKDAGGGQDPDLTETGRDRAEAFDRVVADLDVVALIATPVRRTRETLAPVARRTGLEIREVSPLGDHVAAVVLEIDRCPPGVVLVSGHSNTVPAIVSALSGEEIAALTDEDYDDLFVVVRASGNDRATVAHLHYGAPTP
jgi:broad specificity phosphatase PhoE